MRAYKKERLENAIAYMIKIHTQLTGRRVSQTYIYKYLALIDFKAFEESGKPVFDLDYVAMKKGPVPIELYDRRDEIVDNESFSDVIRLVSDSDGNYWYEKKQEPDLDFLSDYEIELIETTVEEFASKGNALVSDDVVEATHLRIKAWQKAWENRGYSGRVAINPLHTFSGLLGKNEEELNPIEETALFYMTLKNNTIRKCF